MTRPHAKCDGWNVRSMRSHLASKGELLTTKRFFAASREVTGADNDTVSREGREAAKNDRPKGRSSSTVRREVRRSVGTELEKPGGFEVRLAEGQEHEHRRREAAKEKFQRYPAVSGEDHKNVGGSVRFELTIDGSLRHASVLQRVIIR